VQGVFLPNILMVCDKSHLPGAIYKVDKIVTNHMWDNPND